MPNVLDDGRGEIPHSDPGEQIVLAGCLCNTAFRQWALGHLSGEDFWREANRDIWGAIQSCGVEAGSAQPELVAMKLATRGVLDQCGGRQYLTAIQNDAWTIRDDYDALRAAATDLRTVTTARRLLLLGSDLQHRVTAMPAQAERHLAHAQEAMRSIAGGFAWGGGAELVADVAAEFATALHERRNAEFTIAGARTGIRALDNALGGLADQRLIVVMGPTGFGKSMLACQTAFTTAALSARDHIGDVLYYTIEGGRDAILRRFVCWRGGIDQAALRTGAARRSNADEEARIARVVAELPLFPLRVTRQLARLPEVEADVRRVAAEGNVALVVVDHAQAMAQAMGGEERASLKAIGTNLQLLADDLDCPVLLVSQMSTDMSGNAYAMGSRTIDQNASLVIRVDRGEPGTTAEERAQSPQTFLSCTKGRDEKPFGTIKCYGDYARCRIYDEQQWAEQEAADRAARSR
jgi:replicative DNA helicase